MHFFFQNKKETKITDLYLKLLVLILHSSYYINFQQKKKEKKESVSLFRIA